MSKPRTPPEVITFGCRLNAYESQVIARHLRATGLDCFVINSCAVTAEAERQVRQGLRKLRRAHPTARIVLTGCAATLAAQEYENRAEVDAVVVNQQKLSAEPWQALAKKWNCAPQDDTPITIAPQEIETTLRPRANLEIQQGCNHRCTFCIIPYARGDSVSIPVGEVARRLRALVAGGTQEVTLTGVDIASWGAEWGLALPDLLRQVLRQVPDLPRLYLSSLDPIALTPDFFALWGSAPRLQPRLHLSIQAGDDLILKRMARRHRVADLRQAIPTLRRLRPEVALGADLIAGFPTESAQAFERGYDLIAALEIPFLHVFPYSPRAGTPAAKMPQVARPEIRKRAEKLRTLGANQSRGYLRRLDGTRREILFEAPRRGRTPEGVIAQSHTPEAIGTRAVRLVRFQEEQGAGLLVSDA